MSEEKQTRAALAIARAVADAIRDLGEVPSGHLYAHLQGTLTLSQYELVIDLLKKAGLVEESNHLLTWKGGRDDAKR